MRRAGRPAEMAGAALLLCSDAGSYITGADLQATGGRHLGW
ncbi:MAG: SDR family oxidoreductase [Rhizobiales bacterium]|nr:SDR family oxidoreductase [Hyphomicrobiales bacterium]